jgi:hypothetical protein
MNSEICDSGLLARTKAGSVGVYEALPNRYKPTICCLVSSMLRLESDAEDRLI